MVVLVSIFFQLPVFSVELCVDIAVVPEKFEAIFGCMLARSKVPCDDRVDRGRILCRPILLRSNSLRGKRWTIIGLHGPVPQIHDVARHVTKSTGAVVPPSTPCKGCDPRVVVDPGSGADPLFPVDARRNWLCRRGTGKPLRPDGTVRPGVNFFDLANDTRPDQFHAPPHVIVGVGLVSHLRLHASFLG